MNPGKQKVQGHIVTLSRKRDGQGTKRRRKTSEDREWSKSRVNVGEAVRQWRDLLRPKRLTTGVAVLPPLDRRVPSVWLCFSEPLGQCPSSMDSSL